MSSIWTKNLEETRIGAWISDCIKHKIVPVVLISAGVDGIVTGRSYIKRVEFHGIDATLLGVANILLGLAWIKFGKGQLSPRVGVLKVASFMAGAALYVYVGVIAKRY